MVCSSLSGRTADDMFSSSLYRFGLNGSGRWEVVQPTGGKPPASAGHSMVFHSPSRTLLVYGGHRPTTARYAQRNAQPPGAFCTPFSVCYLPLDLRVSASTNCTFVSGSV